MSTLEVRADLARMVYNEIFAHCETFEEDDIGSDLAYIVGTILNDDTASFLSTRPIIIMLQKSFNSAHEIWAYVEVTQVPKRTTWSNQDPRPVEVLKAVVLAKDGHTNLVFIRNDGRITLHNPFTPWDPLELLGGKSPWPTSWFWIDLPSAEPCSVLDKLTPNEQEELKRGMK